MRTETRPYIRYAIRRCSPFGDTTSPNVYLEALKIAERSLLYSYTWVDFLFTSRILDWAKMLCALRGLVSINRSLINITTNRYRRRLQRRNMKRHIAIIIVTTLECFCFYSWNKNKKTTEVLLKIEWNNVSPRVFLRLLFAFILRYENGANEEKMTPLLFVRTGTFGISGHFRALVVIIGGN